MNRNLTEEIAYHVLANLRVLPSTFVAQTNSQRLIDKQFVLPEKLAFEDGDQVISRNIYGCQILVTDNKEFKMLLGDCTIEDDLPEYCLIVQLKDAPVFGVYLAFNRLLEDPPDSEAMIAVSPDKKNWMPCSTYLQATFLAGMEQIKDLGFGWSKCSEYKELHEQLLSFVKFHSKFYGVEDEGKED